MNRHTVTNNKIWMNMKSFKKRMFHEAYSTNSATKNKIINP